MANDNECLFMCIFAIYILYLVNCSNLSTLYQIICFIIVEFWEFFVCSGCKTFSGYVTCKCFLLVYSLTFHSLNSIFHWAKGLFNCLVYQHILDCAFMDFIDYCALGVIHKSSCLIRDHEDFHLFFLTKYGFFTLNSDIWSILS